MIYEANAQFGGEITAFLWHTLVYMFPSLSATAQSVFILLRQCPSRPPCPPSATYSLSMYIFIDEIWQLPLNSSIA